MHYFILYVINFKPAEKQNLSEMKLNLNKFFNPHRFVDPWEYCAIQRMKNVFYI